MIKVLAGGRFNRIHPGHDYFLKKAKSFGDYLVVVIAHDAHNAHGKTPMQQRKESVEKLGIADKVIIGHPDSFAEVISEEKPDVIVLGYDQKLPEGIAETKKIKVVRIEKIGNYSASALSI